MRNEELKKELSKLKEIKWSVASLLTPTCYLTNDFAGNLDKILNKLYTCNIEMINIHINALERELERRGKRRWLV